jgi:hypothetical protein
MCFKCSHWSLAVSASPIFSCSLLVSCTWNSFIILKGFQCESLTYPSLCNPIKIRWVSMFLLYFRTTLCVPVWSSGVQGVFKKSALLSFCCIQRVQMCQIGYVSDHVFGLRLLNMLLSFPVVLYQLCLVPSVLSCVCSVSISFVIDTVIIRNSKNWEEGIKQTGMGRLEHFGNLWISSTDIVEL